MAEQLTREDLERLMFFEQAREQAEQDFAQNSKNAQALTRWGGALLELAHFRQGEDSFTMIDTAVAKFKQAIEIDGSRHDTKWCLGNAYTAQGFLTPDSAKAHDYFDQASDFFSQALELEPTNEIYRKAKEMTKKAPELHAELQRQLGAQGVEGISIGGGGGGGGGSRATIAGDGKGSSGSGISDTWYDIAGWGLLVAIGFGIVLMAKNAPQPGAPPSA